MKYIIEISEVDNNDRYNKEIYKQTIESGSSIVTEIMKVVLENQTIQNMPQYVVDPRAYQDDKDVK